jgi:hypothetical protein
MNAGKPNTGLHKSGLEHANNSRCNMGHVGKHNEHEDDADDKDSRDEDDGDKQWR